jgi:phosphoglycolate phosphatase
MNPYRCVLFDFDGTLADSYAAITASVNHVLHYRGKPELPESIVRTKVGFGLQQLMKDLLPDSDPEENAVIYRQHHPSVMFSHTRLLPGAIELLQRLKEEGIPSGVCSNKPQAITRQLVKSLNVAEFFSVVMGPEDVPHPKPAPDMLLAAMHRLSKEKSETLFVGDMTIDLETARAAGVEVWLVATGSHDWDTLEKAHPDRLLNDLNSVRHHLFPVLLA